MHHQFARNGRAADADQQGGEVGCDQFQIRFCSSTQRLRSTATLPVGSKTSRGEEATNHQKSLHRHARILAQPGDQVGRQQVGMVGHRPVKGQVMQNDQLKGQRLQRVDEGQSRSHPGLRGFSH
jgi:hypothetical protein